jgi:rubrerythrin
MNRSELARAIRQDVIAELDAVALYEAHIDATDDENAKRVITHIMNEEKEHIAEFMTLLEYLDPDQAALAVQATEHATRMIQGLPAEEVEPEQTSPSIPQGLTVGNLIDK